jgi:glutamine amidotransferase
MITIVDYGMGNLGSIQNMLKRIGARSRIVSNPLEIESAEKILLPGVGAFDSAMERIGSAGFRDVLDRKALVERVPVLGICLGMQLLSRSSEEGRLPGLGWIAARTMRLPTSDGRKVPHMGWNLVIQTRPSALTEGLDPDARYYFVHSFFVKVDHEEDSVLKTRYGVIFDAAVEHGNIYGAQFHPEKSHRFGMQLLENFARL